MTCIVNIEELKHAILRQTIDLTALHGSQDIHEWLVRITTKHIVKTKDFLAAIDIGNSSGFDLHVDIARKRGEPLYAFVPLPEFDYETTNIADWAFNLDEHDPKRRKLTRMNYAEALSAAQRWHHRLAKASERLKVKPIPADPVNAPWVLDAPTMGDGWHWVWLKTHDARVLEGASMGHCVGTKRYRDLLYGEAIFSLRDPEGLPHVTMQLYMLEKRQTYCKANSEVSAVYQAAVDNAYQILCYRLAIPTDPDPVSIIADGIYRSNGSYGPYTYHIVNQLPHREDGPAIESRGYNAWYLNGKLHNLNGPAEVTCAYKNWYIDGELIRKEEIENWWKS